MKVTILASGSQANCAVVTIGDVNLMIDAGLGAKDTFRRMLAAGIAPESIAAILVTHEHGDHVHGVVPIAERLIDVPVYMTSGTALKMNWPQSARIRLSVFHAGASFDVRGVRVASFPVPHDAAEPCGFNLTAGGVRLAWATDLGAINPQVAACLTGADVIATEANHCSEMLKVGPYPAHLKARVSGPRGHLSNDAVCEFLEKGLPGTSRVILTHLSAGNNDVSIAVLSARAALGGRAQLSIAATNGGFHDLSQVY